jgi:hypothetical protein
MAPVVPAAFPRPWLPNLDHAPVRRARQDCAAPEHCCPVKGRPKRSDGAPSQPAALGRLTRRHWRHGPPSRLTGEGRGGGDCRRQNANPRPSMAFGAPRVTALRSPPPHTHSRVGGGGLLAEPIINAVASSLGSLNDRLTRALASIPWTSQPDRSGAGTSSLGRGPLTEQLGPGGAGGKAGAAALCHYRRSRASSHRVVGDLGTEKFAPGHRPV